MRDGGCALVTGASRGIGAAVARALAEEGWPVGVNYRSDGDGAERVAGEIEAAGGSAMPVAADVADSSATAALFGAMEERFGPVLVLVNNAGVRADGLSPQLSDDDWHRVINTNLSAAFWTTRRALGPMLRARFGRIVNVASVVGPRANAGQSNYAASKAGLIGFTRTTDVPAEVISAVPARRPGTPEEVAACVRFLAGDAASYVTGTTLTVDGGMSA
jgi:3-oxoacyl-[acyl-carrier protein] reductase